VGQGFSVSPSKLQAGSQEVSRLQERSLIIAEDAIGALGDPDVVVDPSGEVFPVGEDGLAGDAIGNILDVLPEQ
jgi:hypothetical protein